METTSGYIKFYPTSSPMQSSSLSRAASQSLSALMTQGLSTVPLSLFCLYPLFSSILFNSFIVRKTIIWHKSHLPFLEITLQRLTLKVLLSLPSPPCHPLSTLFFSFVFVLFVLHISYFFSGSEKETVPCIFTLRVVDTGIGMNDKEQGRIFKRFSQANNRTSKVCQRERGGRG